MSFFSRIKNGWKLGRESLSVIKSNKSLLVFPVLSTISLIMILGVTFTGGLAVFGFDIDRILDGTGSEGGNEIVAYAILFVYYFINFTVIIFFNVALVYCARQIFEGREATVSEGLSYASSRIGAIVSWAILAATVGLILKIIESRSEAIGKIVAGLLGGVWALATYFVIPIIAYENVGPIGALKRSVSIMKEKWGESLGANFSFGLFYILGILLIALPIGFLGFLIHPIVGIVLGALAFLIISTVVSAAETVFLAAIYQKLNDKPAPQYNDELLDDLFYNK